MSSPLHDALQQPNSLKKKFCKFCIFGLQKAKASNISSMTGLKLLSFLTRKSNDIDLSVSVFTVFQLGTAFPLTEEEGILSGAN